ncbi:MAG: SPOR domain-containing protein [Porphyromonas sp.]|nr:SPOR domain-containing protein [Porphyromonas sp.]
MKAKMNIVKAVIAVIIGIWCLPASAQASNERTIFDALFAYKPGSGVVIITQSDAIEAGVVHNPTLFDNVTFVNGYAVVQGFRIQAYSGNRSNSKSIATQRKSQLDSRYPELQTTVEYDSPFWRVRIGNFTNRAEAQQQMEELKKAFPAFAGEMYIVQTNVRISRQDL